jgi:hypothetical protein
MTETSINSPLMTTEFRTVLNFFFVLDVVNLYLKDYMYSWHLVVVKRTFIKIFIMYRKNILRDDKYKQVDTLKTH